MFYYFVAFFFVVVFILFHLFFLFLRVKFITSRNPSPWAIVSSYIFCFYCLHLYFCDQVSLCQVPGGWGYLKKFWIGVCLPGSAVLTLLEEETN